MAQAIEYHDILLLHFSAHSLGTDIRHWPRAEYPCRENC